MEFANKVKGVDAILGGHTHNIEHAIINNIPVDIANCYCEGYIDLKISLDSNGRVSYPEKEGKYHSINKEYKSVNPDLDNNVIKILKKAEMEIGPDIGKVEGTAIEEINAWQDGEPFGDSALGNWAAKAVRESVNADFGFINNGGLRANINKGKIIFDQIFKLMPFDNHVVTVTMKGSQIKELLEQAVGSNGKGIQEDGLSFVYNPDKQDDQKVIEIKKINSKNTENLDINKSYLVATNDFMGTGGDGFKIFTEPEVSSTYKDTGKLIRDIFADVILKADKEGKSIDAKCDKRIQPVVKGKI
jgi:2',3'-cyclic-nucleotide 2'-phosphodiesterase / 3'-nucleotidase / 5'-nucleotidase